MSFNPAVIEDLLLIIEGPRSFDECVIGTDVRFVIGGGNPGDLFIHIEKLGDTDPGTGFRSFSGFCVRNARVRVSGGFLSWVVLYCSLRGCLVRTLFDSLPCYDFVCEVCSVVLFCMRPCLNPSLRGRPRTIGRIRARARSARHR